jgi:hypothetical protein
MKMLCRKHAFLLAFYGGEGWWGERPREPLRPISALFSTATLSSYHMVGPELPLCPNKKGGAISHHQTIPLPVF